ncbi:MAG: stage V sporulation protein AC [Acutalibacteraceae bacterium]|nr:stage V sporulation protein AC [Acutalibacteraceae bacterium]HIR03493.1 stage V sporulation protein AC [Candidatus Scatovicinus merdipullorum]
MRISKKQYAKMAEKASPKSNLFVDCIKAFLVGGLICTIGQGLTNIYTLCGMELLDARTLTSVSLVFLGALLTSIGVYDKIAKHAGAGSLVPITGFANSIVAPAIEFKSEGFVLGLGAKMFIIAGPVLVYGITASVLWGVIYFILKLTGVMQ